MSLLRRVFGLGDRTYAETFNFGAEIVDRLARESDGPALLWENEAGQGGAYGFADIARLSNRLANALRADGIGKGDFMGKR